LKRSFAEAGLLDSAAGVPDRTGQNTTIMGLAMPLMIWPDLIWNRRVDPFV